MPCSIGRLIGNPTLSAKASSVDQFASGREPAPGTTFKACGVVPQCWRGLVVPSLCHLFFAYIYFTIGFYNIRLDSISSGRWDNPRNWLIGRSIGNPTVSARASFLERSACGRAPAPGTTFKAYGVVPQCWRGFVGAD